MEDQDKQLYLLIYSDGDEYEFAQLLEGKNCVERVLVLCGVSFEDALRGHNINSNASVVVRPIAIGEQVSIHW